jgi:hypothetical protein
MRTRRTPIVASLVAAFALVVTAALAGGAAPAQAYYFKNPDHSLLRFPPKFPGFRPCFTDTVTLPRGGYLHGAYMVSKSHRTRPDLEQVNGRGPKNSALMTFENDQGRQLVYGNGQYEWGGRIVRDCPGCTSPSG